MAEGIPGDWADSRAGSSGPWRPYVWTPRAWGARWAAAKAEAGSELARLAVVSHSIGRGELASNWWDLGFVGLLRTALQAQLGDGGSGAISHAFRGAPGTTVCTTTGAWTNVDNEGGILRRSLRPTTPGNGAIISSTIRGTRGDIWFRTAPAFGTWDWRVDGGAWTPVNLGVAASILKAPLPPLVPGSHVIDVRATTGDGRYYLTAGENAAGVVVHNMSVEQTGIDSMRAQTTGLSTPDLYDNTMIRRTLEAIAPLDAVIFLGSAADVGLDVDDATWRSNIWDGLSCLHHAVQRSGRSLAQPPDLIVMAEHIGKADDLPGFGQFEKEWNELHGILQSFAASTGAVFADLWGTGRRSWDYWASLNLWGAGNTDGVHPNDAGHQMYVGPLKDQLIFA